MGSLHANEEKEHAAAVRKALGGVLRQSYDDVVTSRVPDRMRDLLQRLDHAEETRSLNSKKWW